MRLMHIHVKHKNACDAFSSAGPEHLHGRFAHFDSGYVAWNAGSRRNALVKGNVERCGPFGQIIDRDVFRRAESPCRARPAELVLYSNANRQTTRPAAEIAEHRALVA